MLLSKALNIQRGDIVAFIGAGGKTSALTRLAQELRHKQWRILVTTTTKMGENEMNAFPIQYPYDGIHQANEISQLLSGYGTVFLYERVWGNKVLGITPGQISQLVDYVDSDVILIEADGARRMPLKAPYDHEPVIPLDTSLVVPVAGMDAVGQPFEPSTVYNFERVQEHYGFAQGQTIQYAWLAQIVRDPELGLQGIPDGARVVALLNKTGGTVLDRIKTRRTAHMILKEKRVDAVAFGSVQRRKTPIYEVQKRIGAIVLAAGMSRRMGQSKPLLQWGQQTVIETIVQRLLPLRLADVVVITGYESNQVSALVKKAGARSIYNRRYATGEMLSSLQAGLKAMDESIAACLVFLGDQPSINPRLVNEILVTYARGKSSIVAPSYNNRRGHPILIDRRHWSEIQNLPDGGAPRDVINAYNDDIAYVMAKDDNILRDMDTPEEYREALKRAGLL